MIRNLIKQNLRIYNNEAPINLSSLDIEDAAKIINNWRLEEENNMRIFNEKQKTPEPESENHPPAAVNQENDEPRSSVITIVPKQNSPLIDSKPLSPQINMNENQENQQNSSLKPPVVIDLDSEDEKYTEAMFDVIVKSKLETEKGRTTAENISSFIAEAKKRSESSRI